jgi:hypothetical protein
MVDGNLTDFPLIVNITDTGLRDHAQPSDNDVCFVDAGNTVRLNHEIEKFNSTTGQLVAWVNVPSVSSVTNTTIYMYYGNPACASQQNAAGVWDSHFKLVDHLEELSGTVHDSTSNANNGTPNNVVQGVEGKIDGADYFNGVNANVNVTNSPSLNPTSQMTLEFWASIGNLSADSGGYRRIVSKGRSWIDGGYHINLEKGYPRFAIRTNNAQQTVTATTLPDLKQWYYIVGTYNGSSLRIYINGTLENENSVTGPLQNSNGTLLIGCETSDQRYFNGSIDEVRISDVARNASWIKTCYNSMNDPSGFIRVGAEQSNPVQPVVPEFPSILILPVFMTLTLLIAVVYKKKTKWACLSIKNRAVPCPDIMC